VRLRRVKRCGSGFPPNLKPPVVPLIESVSKLLVFAEVFDYDRRKQRRRRKR